MKNRNSWLWGLTGLALGLSLTGLWAAIVRPGPQGRRPHVPFGPSVYHTLFGPVHSASRQSHNSRSKPGKPQ